jgi:type I restriction enzyme S subunit
LLKAQDLPKLARGVKPGINREQIYSLLVPIPDINEQQRIVATLDTAFADLAQAKANAEKNLANAKELFASELASITGFPKNLGSFASIKTGKLDANAAIDNGKYPFFTCAREIYKINDFAFDCEALLLAGNNASGDFNVKYYKGRFNAYQRTYVITLNEDASYRYIYHLLIRALAELKEKSVGAATKFLKMGIIQSLEFPFPSFPEQQRIAARLDELSEHCKKLEAVYTQKLSLYDEMKQSLLRKAFSGEL